MVVRQVNNSRNELISDLDKSLSRLNIDYVDLMANSYLGQKYSPRRDIYPLLIMQPVIWKSSLCECLQFQWLAT